MSRQIESRAIRKPRQHEEFLDQLVGKGRFSENDAPFGFLYQALVFAAVIGFKANYREVLATGSGKDAIDYPQMSKNAHFESLLAIFAVLKNKDDHTCLSGDNADERIKVFEEYACGGLTLLKEAQVGYGGSLRDYVEAEVVRELTSIASVLESEEEESSS